MFDQVVMLLRKVRCLTLIGLSRVKHTDKKVNTAKHTEKEHINSDIRNLGHFLHSMNTKQYHFGTAP